MGVDEAKPGCSAAVSRIVSNRCIVMIKALWDQNIYTFEMALAGCDHRYGDVVALRYITTDGRIEMCWPCRVVADRDDLVVLFIAAGTPYKAGPKQSAAEKRPASTRGTASS